MGCIAPSLKECLMAKDKKLRRKLQAILRASHGKVSAGPLYLYAPGEIPMCLVAHYDTLVKTEIELVLTNNVLTNKHGLLGADDRAGIYAICKVLEARSQQGLPLPSVLFTDLEESGGLGVREFIQHGEWGGKDRLFIELDRRGVNDYVFYSFTLPKQVKSYIETFGYIERNGSYSDIANLTDEYCVPAVNLSVGYYHEHSASECLHLDELGLAINRVVDILESPIDALYKVESFYFSYDWKQHYRSYWPDMKAPSFEDGEWGDLPSLWGEDLYRNISILCPFRHDAVLMCDTCPHMVDIAQDYLECDKIGLISLNDNGQNHVPIYK